LYLFSLDDYTIRKLANLRAATGYRPSWSPDSRALVYEVDNAPLGTGVDLYVVRIDAPLGEDNPYRLTDRGDDDRYAQWSPRGERILFTGYRQNGSDIYTVAADGSDLLRLTPSVGYSFNATWSPQGDQIIYVSNRRGTSEIYLMNVEGGELRQLTDRTFSFWSPPVWSPDGREVVFIAEFDFMSSIARLNIETGEINRISNNSALDVLPLWTPDGGSLIFMSYRSGRWGLFHIDKYGRQFRRITFGHGSSAYPIWGP
jgi:TolB protein